MTNFNVNVAIDLNEKPEFNLTIDEVLMHAGVYQHDDNSDEHPDDFILVFPSASCVVLAALYVNEDKCVIETLDVSCWDGIWFRKCDHVNVEVILKRGE